LRIALLPGDGDFFVQGAWPAYLVALAKAHGLKLATLNESLCAKGWARGIAENPLNHAVVRALPSAFRAFEGRKVGHETGEMLPTGPRAGMVSSIR
jgi:hypothetical protein